MKRKLGMLMAAMGLAAAGQSQAVVVLPTSDVNNTGGSELVLTVFNSNTQKSYSRDLGVSFNQLLGGAGLAAYTADTSLQSLDLTDPNFQWNVTAADGITNGASVPEFGTRVLTTINNSGTPSTTNSELSQSTTSLTQFVNGLNILSTHDTETHGSSISDGPPDNGNWLSGYTTQWQYPESGSIGDSMAFWFGKEFAFFDTSGRNPGPNTNPSDQAIYEQLGTFTLDNLGTLTYVSASVNPVPVPAAVWLFGSGIVGLVAVARRRAGSKA